MVTDEEFLLERRRLLFEKAVRDMEEAAKVVEGFGWKVKITVTQNKK